MADIEISQNLPEEERQEIQGVLSEYAEVFYDIPHIANAAEHHIFTHEEKPIRCSPYRIPNSQKAEFEKELCEMLELGIIEKSESDWASPVVLVGKKDSNGKKTGIRVCIDYRKLNSVTKFDAFPLPRMEELLENIGSAKHISKFDMTKGYWQIPLSKESKPLFRQI